eukprot:GHVN01075876.1.p1 GENE.GHVN01075876.1~~GHVN01075876.1.p1  ORF type:complete len:188 (+),score=38.31 GHVN01075876.1:296-859(+)
MIEMRRGRPFHNGHISRSVSPSCLEAILNKIVSNGRGAWLPSQEALSEVKNLTCPTHPPDRQWFPQTVKGSELKKAGGTKKVEIGGDVGAVKGAGGGVGDTSHLVFAVWWKPVTEWASVVYEWALQFRINKIETEYWLTQGDDTTGQSFHGMPVFHFRLVLKELVKQKKALVFTKGDNTGIKFVVPK